MLLHPDVELHEWPESPDSRHCRGVNQALQLRDSWFDAWDSLAVAVDEYLESGDRIVACGKAHAMGQGSTVPVDFESYTVFTLRDDKIARMEFFIRREQALGAAGIEQTQEAR